LLVWNVGFCCVTTYLAYGSCAPPILKAILLPADDSGSPLPGIRRHHPPPRRSKTFSVDAGGSLVMVNGYMVLKPKRLLTTRCVLSRSFRDIVSLDGQVQAGSP
jgi:hypothetical protein